MMMSSSSSSNGTDRMTLGGYAGRHGYYVPATPAPAVDAELSLGRGYGGKDQRPIRSPRVRPSSSPAPFSTRVCSLCNKTFTSLQALGVHQVSHRRALEMVRRRRGNRPVAAGGKAPTANSQPPGGRQPENGGTTAPMNPDLTAPMNPDLTLGCGYTGEPEEGLDLILRL